MDYNEEAKTILKTITLGYEEIRELLILTVIESCTEADSFFKESIQCERIEILDYLVRISGDFDDFGDAPIQAPYYIKEYPSYMLKSYEDEMIHSLLNDERGARAFLSIALGKIKSEKAKEYIYNLAEDKEILGNWIFEEARKLYES
ncbi:MAG: hypothetical protein H7Y18_20540 [Clostridiaceae bacterium]|nr:hypothetical protein [Clostridiaceae bacterium]